MLLRLLPAQPWPLLKVIPTAPTLDALLSALQGGANAGHTIYDEQGNKYKLHLIPSGVLNPKATCVVGNGVVVHLPSLFDEIKGMKVRCCPCSTLVHAFVTHGAPSLCDTKCCFCCCCCPHFSCCIKSAEKAGCPARPMPHWAMPHRTCRTLACPALQERGVTLDGRLLISDRAHLLFDLHKEIDGAREAELAGTGKQVRTSALAVFRCPGQTQTSERWRCPTATSSLRHACSMQHADCHACSMLQAPGMRAAELARCTRCSLLWLHAPSSGGAAQQLRCHYPPLSHLLAAARLQIGTTKRGIGPAYSSKATRNGVRVGDLRRPEQFAGMCGWLAAAVGAGSAQAAGHCLAICDVMYVQCSCLPREFPSALLPKALSVPPRCCSLRPQTSCAS